MCRQNRPIVLWMRSLRPGRILILSWCPASGTARAAATESGGEMIFLSGTCSGASRRTGMRRGHRVRANTRVNGVIAAVLLALVALGVRAAQPSSALRPAMDAPNVKIDAPAVSAPPEPFFKLIEERLSNPRRFGSQLREGQDPPKEQKPSAETIAAQMAIYRNFYQKYI